MAPSLDSFGGNLSLSARAAGFFRVAQIADRWYIITPDGHGFLSMGVNHFDLAALKYADNIHIFRERYGGEDDRYIREGIAAPLRDWGFNTIGWTQELVGGTWGAPSSLIRHSHEWEYRNFKTAGMPFLYNLPFSEIEWFNARPHYPDVFGDDFARWCDYQARRVCADMADEPLLIGYADLPVPDFLRVCPGSWAENLDLDDPSDVKSLQGIARQYFEVTTAAIRRYDPNHMILGPRFSGRADTPDWLIAIAGEFFDFILCNRFVTPDYVADDLRRWHRLSGRPILIADMAFLAPTHILSPKEGSQAYVPDQRARGEAYQVFSRAVLKNPYILGFHWCGFLENRTRKSGIKNCYDEPYWDCVDRMKRFNTRELYPSASKEEGFDKSDLGG